MQDQTVLTLVIWVGLMAITGYVAYRKGSSFWLWAVLGGLFAIVALPVAIFMRADQAALANREIKAGRAKQCPYCFNLIHPQASVCPYCNQWVVQQAPYYPPRY